MRDCRHPRPARSTVRHALLAAVLLAPAVLSTDARAQTAPAAPAAPASAALPADVQAQIRKQYAVEGMELRYVDGSIDLNGDAKPELLVHVVGGGACGTGGCPTLVFTPTDTTHRLVSTIGLTNLPIRASAKQTKGWRNLIVHVAGGGAKAGDVELAFDGTRYPRNPTVSGTRVAAAAVENAPIVIKPFASFDQATPLPPAGAAK